MAGIEARIEYGRNHTLAAAYLLAKTLVNLVYAGCPGVCIVVYLFILRSVIIFGNINRSNAAHLRNLVGILDIDVYGNRIEKKRIAVLVFIGNARFAELRKKIFLLVLKLLAGLFTIFRIKVVGKLLIPAARGKALAFKRNNQPLIAAYCRAYIYYGIGERRRRIRKFYRVVFGEGNSVFIAR